MMNKDEVYQVMERAMQKRRTAETLLNATSSRSHVVFTVTVHIKSVAEKEDIGECEEEVFKMGKFNLVSLIGYCRGGVSQFILLIIVIQPYITRRCQK